MPSIECHDLTCRYGSRVALKGVELKIEEGTWTYVLGPSGGGKTTLLRAIAGLEPLAQGSISIAGRIASERKVLIPPHERGIGFVFQETSLWPHLTAEANVALGIPGSGLLRSKLGTARSYLEQLGVGEAAKRFPGEVSGGQAQRICIARAIASRPRILLLDEPTAHLDLHLREELMQNLIKLHHGEKLTAICVMHQIEPPMNNEDRVVILEEAGIIFDGKFPNLSEAPETPFSLALARHILRDGDWLQRNP